MLDILTAVVALALIVLLAIGAYTGHDQSQAWAPLGIVVGFMVRHRAEVAARRAEPEIVKRARRQARAQGLNEGHHP